MMTNTALSGLLGTLVLCAGLPANAAESSLEPADSGSAAAAEKESGGEGAADETVRVTISLPSGRKIVLEENADSDPFGARVTRVLPDGSRISYGTGQTSSRQAARGRSGSRGGTSAARSSGGGGGGARAATASSGGGGGGARAMAGGGGSGGGGGGVAATASGASARAPKVAAAVPTIGAARHDQDGATGGQNVRFHEAGISAMVVGRTVFIWGADLVQSTEEFALVNGERFAFDGAMAAPVALELKGGPVTSREDIKAPLKLDFDPNTTVTLTMHSKAENPELPAREIRTWTVRVR